MPDVKLEDLELFPEVDVILCTMVDVDERLVKLVEVDTLKTIRFLKKRQKRNDTSYHLTLD